jgi:hypothetical protein
VKKYGEDKISVSGDAGLKNSFTPYSPLLIPSCSACGTENEREFAKYCRVCGKFLPEDYQPLDAIRASHRLHGKAIFFESQELSQPEKLFETNDNGISQTAWACLVYSLVPYIGIVFIPLTLLMGSAGIFVSFQKPSLGGRRLSAASISLSFVVLAIQILLWWLLYLIPTLGRQFQ